jgi:hypothetical protein
MFLACLFAAAQGTAAPLPTQLVDQAAQMRIIGEEVGRARVDL